PARRRGIPDLGGEHAIRLLRNVAMRGRGAGLVDEIEGALADPEGARLDERAGGGPGRAACGARLREDERSEEERAPDEGPHADRLPHPAQSRQERLRHQPVWWRSIASRTRPMSASRSS